MFYIYSTRNILVHSFPASCAAVYGAALPESEFDFKKLNLYYVQLDLDGPYGVLICIAHSNVVVVVGSKPQQYKIFQRQHNFATENNVF